jgi:hypothetical protein
MINVSFQVKLLHFFNFKPKSDPSGIGLLVSPGYSIRASTGREEDADPVVMVISLVFFDISPFI